MTEDASENRFLDTVREARRVWLEENDPRDGTDCVTPFDKFLYGLPVECPHGLVRSMCEQCEQEEQ